ncbi:hypothetical protein GCM10028787_00690 [Brachybacterium horti]
MLDRDESDEEEDASDDDESDEDDDVSADADDDVSDSDASSGDGVAVPASESVGAALLVAAGVVAAAADVLATPCSPTHSAPAPIPVAASAVPAITPVAKRPRRRPLSLMLIGASFGIGSVPILRTAWRRSLPGFFRNVRQAARGSVTSITPPGAERSILTSPSSRRTTSATRDRPSP